MLKAHGIEDLVVCGMHTGIFIVDTTTRRLHWRLCQSRAGVRARMRPKSNAGLY
jgi:hypothetical protein